MTTTLTKNTQQINTNILCIPRVFPNIRETRIHAVINELNMCKIEKIDVVQKTGEKGEKFNRVFIHIKEWYQNNTNAQAAQERLKEGKDIKIIYDDPWFWKVSAYRKPQYQNKQDQQQQQQHKQQANFYNKKKARMVIENEKQHNKQEDEDAKIDMLINEMMMNTNSPNSPPPKAVTLKKRILGNVRKDPPRILSVINPDDIDDETDNKDLDKDNKDSNNETNK
jgi:hypothetical protein